MEPASLCRMPIKMFKNVDFPAPFPPHKAWTDLGRKLNRPSRRAGTPENDFAMPRALSNKPLDGSAKSSFFAPWGESITVNQVRMGLTTIALANAALYSAKAPLPNSSAKNFRAR
jgi:hypothetical protein